MEAFNERRVGPFYRRVDNQRCVAGHARLFRIFMYRYSRAPAEEWALERVWSCGLFAIHHIGEGLSRSPPGWHVTFARLSFTRQYGGITIRWSLADLYRTCRP